MGSCRSRYGPFLRIIEAEAMIMVKRTEPKDLKANFFTLLSQRWALLTVADGEGCNPMTVSWGGVGILWNKPVATVYVRPQRYTRGLMDKENYFSLTFLSEELHDVAAFCGSKSGREVDKVKECGLTVMGDEKAPYFAQGELTLICRKLYQQDMTGESFVDPAVDEKNYPGKDYHRMYVGEIVAVLEK